MQKKLCYFLVALVAFIMVSCDAKLKSLPISATLATFTEKDAAGKEDLLGVREMGTDKVIIKPDNFKIISADDCFITAVKMVDGVRQIWLYRFDGECVGWFDTYNYFSSPENYVIATNYNETFFYFPKTDMSITTFNSYSAVNYLFIQDDCVWKVYTYDGDLVTTLPLESKLIHNLTSDAKEAFYVITEDKEQVTLFDIEKKKTKTCTMKEWLDYVSDLRIVKEIPHLTILEVKNF